MMFPSKTWSMLFATLLAGCGQQIVHFGQGACDDGNLNGSETDVDCGGLACGRCDDHKDCLTAGDCKSGLCMNAACAPVPATCRDGIRNGTETDLDCGGAECPACADTQACLDAHDCSSGICAIGTCRAPSCTDGARNGTETDVDCGGSACPGCATGRDCRASSDCAGGLCLDG